MEMQHTKMWAAAKTGLGGHFIRTSGHPNKKVTDNLTLHLKELEDEDQAKNKVRQGGNSRDESGNKRIDLKRQQRRFMKLSAVSFYFLKINKQPVS